MDSNADDSDYSDYSDDSDDSDDSDGDFSVIRCICRRTSVFSFLPPLATGWPEIAALDRLHSLLAHRREGRYGAV